MKITKRNVPPTPRREGLFLCRDCARPAMLGSILCESCREFAFEKWIAETSTAGRA